jgi:ADP-ribose pyrophosphatase YjhB (NUDIX family)
MPHIHSEENQHDMTVTAYIVRIDTPEPKALVHMHKKLGRLLPVGGHVELLETPWQAVGHELEEESGYELEQLKVIQPKSRLKHMTRTVQHPYPISMNTHDIPGNHFHTDIEYGFIADSNPELSIGDDESLDLRWLTQAELNALDNSLLFDNTKEVYNFLFDEALPNWERVDTSDFVLDFPDEYRG